MGWTDWWSCSFYSWTWYSMNKNSNSHPTVDMKGKLTSQRHPSGWKIKTCVQRVIQQWSGNGHPTRFGSTHIQITANAAFCRTHYRSPLLFQLTLPLCCKRWCQRLSFGCLVRCLLDSASLLKRMNCEHTRPISTTTFSRIKIETAM